MHKAFLFAVGLISFSTFSFSQDIDVLHYRFEISLSDRSRSDTSNWIHGKATIEFKALRNINAVVFDFPDLIKPNDLRATGIYQGRRDDNRCTIKIAKSKLTIFLQDSLKAGDRTQLTISYMGVPTDGLIISKNNYGDKTYFADNWPDRAHYWIPCNDRPDDKASFEFIVTAPSQYKVVSNGVKIEEKNLGDGKTLTHWKEDTPLPTKVMVIGVAKFAVKTFQDSPSNIPVSAWVYQQDSAKGFHDYAPAPEILKFFSSYIAPYPYKKLANVQSKTIFGGMENASAIFYFEGSVTGRGGIEDLLAHEIAHQWFGDMATEKSFAHLWLSEGFATYFTDIYWQHKYGNEAFKKRLQKERDEIIDFVKTNDRPVVDSLSPYMDLLNANSYQKGGWVLHMLRNEVGDSVFHKIVQTYYQQYKGSNADTRDFEAVAEKVAGKNLKWFFDQWLYRPGIPQLHIEQKIDNDDVKLRITQEGVKFEFPLEASFVRADGSVLKQIIYVNDQMIEFKIKVPDVRSVIIDPDTNLLYSEMKK
jgi:aminopeptidase N